MKTNDFDENRSQQLAQAHVVEHAGFPNPATDRSLQSLDLNQLLIRHSAATYFMRIEGDSWHDLGILDDDIVVIDRAISAHKNDLVIWWQGEHFTLGPAHQLPKNTPSWGVVTTAIHQFKENP